MGVQADQINSHCKLDYRKPLKQSLNITDLHTDIQASTYVTTEPYIISEGPGPLLHLFA